MHVEVIDSSDTLARLRGNWDAVYEADPDAQFFMSWTWISGWFERLGCQWLIFAAKETADSRDYVAFFPLQLRTEMDATGHFHNELRTGGGYFAGYTGFVCDPRFETEAIRAFAHHARQLNWSKLHLENFFVSQERFRLFFDGFSSSDFILEKVRRPDDGDNIDHDIYIYVNLPGSWDAFLNLNMGSETRQNARRTLRKVEAGEFRITHATSDTIERDLQTLLQLWERQWGPKLAARYNPALPKGMARNFYNMLGCCFRDGCLFLPVLWQGQSAIGAQARLIDRKKRSLIAFVSARDMTVKRPSPGFALNLHSVRWAIENGLTVYDLQTGDFSYKYDFGGLERRVECLLLRTKSGQTLREALEIRSLPVVFARLLTLQKAGRFAEAEVGCQQILDVAPRHEGALTLLDQLREALCSGPPVDLDAALQLHRGGRLAEAERIYRSILRTDPEHVQAIYLLGVVFLQQGRFQAAERQLSRAIQINPSVAAAYSNRGNALRGLRRLEEALASYDKAIALKPDYAEALNNRGATLYDLGRVEEALASYDKAIALKPSYTKARQNRDKAANDLARRREAHSIQALAAKT
jgi:CelD/BcsL family acetyltransferase involved in cellulose biosynthesis/Flp pilus assembly protein TadD